MEKVLGIISEYNPFHNGHLYHLQESKKLASCKYSIAIISGNFTQRGDTSIVDKWSKAQMALNAGVDLVIELPVLYAVSSAENFAEGAIKILDSLKIVDYISFGSETGNINILNAIADVLCNEPKEYKNILALQLDKGLSYPKARENALMMYLNDVRRFANVLSSPNNILGIEYLKALKKQKSNIIPLSIKRIEAGYNSKSITSSITSATAIRNAITNNNIAPLKNVMPKASFEILLDNLKKGHVIKNLSCFDKEILYNLRKMSVEEIAELPDVSEGLEYLIKKAANSCNSVIELLNIVNSKRYTKTRLQRILVYALLGITKKDMKAAKTTLPYIRVLGFNENGRDILSAISNVNPKLPIITSVKKFADNSTNKNLNTMVYKDIWATDVYSLGYEYDSWSNLDFTHKLITLNL
jgi:predicted nucleotidyltransferase